MLDHRCIALYCCKLAWEWTDMERMGVVSGWEFSDPRKQSLKELSNEALISVKTLLLNRRC